MELRGDGVTWCGVECVWGGGVYRICRSTAAEEFLCETWFPKGFLVSWQKSNLVKDTGSAMRSGTGTLSFFYVACDHGRCGALGGL